MPSIVGTNSKHTSNSCPSPWLQVPSKGDPANALATFGIRLKCLKTCPQPALSCPIPRPETAMVCFPLQPACSCTTLLHHHFSFLPLCVLVWGAVKHLTQYQHQHPQHPLHLQHQLLYVVWCVPFFLIFYLYE